MPNNDVLLTFFFKCLAEAQVFLVKKVLWSVLGELRKMISSALKKTTKNLPIFFSFTIMSFANVLNNYEFYLINKTIVFCQFFIVAENFLNETF